MGISLVSLPMPGNKHPHREEVAQNIFDMMCHTFMSVYKVPGVLLWSSKNWTEWHLVLTTNKQRWHCFLLLAVHIFITDIRILKVFTKGQGYWGKVFTCLYKWRWHQQNCCFSPNVLNALHWTTIYSNITQQDIASLRDNLLSQHVQSLPSIFDSVAAHVCTE